MPGERLNLETGDPKTLLSLAIAFRAHPPRFGLKGIPRQNPSLTGQLKYIVAPHSPASTRHQRFSGAAMAALLWR